MERVSKKMGKFLHSNHVMGTENMEILKVVIADDEVRICQLIQALESPTTERKPAKWYGRHSRIF